MFEHVTIVRSPVDTQGRFRRQLQHVLMKDGEPWATLTIMSEGSLKEQWCAAWFDREVCRLNQHTNHINPALACVPQERHCDD